MKKILLIFMVLIGTFNISNSGEFVKDIHGDKVKIDFLIKDKSVYFGTQKLERIDYASFKEVSEFYVKDKNGIYYFFVNHIIAGINDYEASWDETGNWFDSSLKGDDQKYGVEASLIKLEEANMDDYKVKDQYLFSNNYVFNRGQLVTLKKNKYFTVDQKTLESIDQYCGFGNRHHKQVSPDIGGKKCDIIIKDKNKLYVLTDNIGKENTVDEQGYSAENVRETKVYEIKNIDRLTFNKVDFLKYKDKNNTYTFQDLIKKGVQK